VSPDDPAFPDGQATVDRVIGDRNIGKASVRVGLRDQDDRIGLDIQLGESCTLRHTLQIGQLEANDTVADTELRGFECERPKADGLTGHRGPQSDTFCHYMGSHRVVLRSFGAVRCVK
jgi:hypothetical protein